MPVSIERRKIPSVDERLTLSLVHHRSRLLLIRVGPQQFENKTLRCLSETAQHSSIKRSFIMRPSSLGGGRIMRRTLSGRLSVCPSVCGLSRYRHRASRRATKAVIDLYEPVSDSIEATTGSTSQISYRPITSQTSTSGSTFEVLVCDVIGRYDICEVLPVVASIESETGSYKSITALVALF